MNYEIASVITLITLIFVISEIMYIKMEEIRIELLKKIDNLDKRNKK